MSTFEVKVVRVDNVEKHPNADKLTINTIGGYRCISNLKDDGEPRYATGDLVVYIPEGAVVPDWLLQKMGFWDKDNDKGFLSGPFGNRVKAIKLRGIVSQGILMPVCWAQREGMLDEPYIDGHINEHATEGFENRKWVYVEEGSEVAEFLGITKYEPPIPEDMQGLVGNLFGYTKKYDIENYLKHPDAFEEGEYVSMYEKIHGTCFQFGLISNMNKEDKNKAKEEATVTELPCGAVCFATSKGYAQQGIVQKWSRENRFNLYIRTAQEYFFGEDKLAEMICEHFSDYSKNFRVIIMGEIFGKGVQDLNYGLEKKEVRFFDIYIHDEDTDTGHWLNGLDLMNFCIKFKIKMPALLYSGPFSHEKADEFRSGDTVTGKGAHMREGVVISPHEPREVMNLPSNRLKLKYHSDEYLLRKGGTEYN